MCSGGMCPGHNGGGGKEKDKEIFHAANIGQFAKKAYISPEKSVSLEINSSVL